MEKLLTNNTVATQVAQPLKRLDPVSAQNGNGAVSSDALDEHLNTQLNEKWQTFLAKAEEKTTGGDPKLIFLAPQDEAPKAPPPRLREKAPEPSREAPSGNRPREAKGGDDWKRCDDPRKEMVRDRAQIEARSAETEQFAREVSARESLVQEVRGIATAKRTEASLLRTRVAERRASLCQFELEMDEVISQPNAYLDRFEEVERMLQLRYQLNAELQSEESAARQAEDDAARYAALAVEHESSLAEGLVEVERRRTAIVSDREANERRSAEAERRAGLMDHTAETGSLQFWSALARAGEIEQASFEARRAQDQLDSRNGNAGAELRLKF